MLFAGCSTAPKVEYREIPAPKPPAAILEQCTVVDVKINTVRDLVKSRNAYRKAFCECSQKIEALRAFHDGIPMSDSCDATTNTKSSGNAEY